jgi:hypothetical protein
VYSSALNTSEFAVLPHGMLDPEEGDRHLEVDRYLEGDRLEVERQRQRSSRV